MEVKGDLISNWTFFKDQWENYKVTNGLRDKSKNVTIKLQRLLNVHCKKDYMFEDGEDMISACDTQEFKPFGRTYCAIHPGKTSVQVKGTDSTDHGLPLVKALRDISISKEGKKQSWRLRSCADSTNGNEEELYIHENTVVWSRKTSDGAAAVIKSFTVDSPVHEALWYSFLLPADVQPDETGSPLIHKQQGVCIIESRSVSVFTTDGKDYVTPIPFQIRKTWPIMNGLFFERECTEKSSHPVTRTPKKEEKQQSLPILFSMLHPLDDIAPVICRTGAASNSLLGNTSSAKVSFVTETSQQIVFTSEEPSLVMTYDRLLSAHSIWSVRMTRKEEVLQVRGNQLGDLHMMMSSSCNPSDLGSVTPTISKASSSHLSRLNVTQSPSFSPFRSYHSKPNSPMMTHSKHSSPSVSHLAALSRTQSPSTSGSHLVRLHSPLSSSAIKHFSPSLARTPGSHINNTSFSDPNIYPQDTTAPLDPEVCVDHIWTESGVARDGVSGCASKVFLTADLCGQRYICYLIPYRQQLRCVKFEESNDRSQLIFGSMSTITCKDASSLLRLNMILILDCSANLVLYSGTTKVSLVHMAEIPAPLPLSTANTPHPPISMVLRPASPLRFISGPITSSRPPSALDVRFDEEVQMLSPVPTEFNESSQLMENSLTDELSFQQSSSSSPATLISSIRDAVGHRFCVELSDGSMYRASLPQMSHNPIIEQCMEGFRQILPRDISLLVLTRWYAASNSPGCVNGQSEWTQFCRCVLSLMGYDVDRLPLTMQANSTPSPVSAKKSRPSDQGSEEDWENLLQSQHHKVFAETQEDVSGFEGAQKTATKKAEEMSLDTGAALFPHIPAVLFALHLVYEELKLHSVINEDLGGLAELLYQLSCDLHCELYTDHYSRDWPTLYSKAHHRSCIPEENLQQMQQPSFFTRIPPKIYEWLLSYLRGAQVQPFPYLAGVSESTKYVIAMFVVMFEDKDISDIMWSEFLRKVARAGHRSPDFEESLVSILKEIPKDSDRFERLVLFMSKLESLADILVDGVSLLLKEAMFQCREQPPGDWSKAAYTLIGREDLARQYEKHSGESLSQDRQQAMTCIKGVKEEEDGMEHLHQQLLKLRFSEDLRVHEVRKLLQSSKPVKIVIAQRPEVSDHEFIEEQERHLYATCIRTMALPVGRGLFTLSTYQPLPTETLPIPKLSLTGRASPRNTTVDLTHIDTPANMNHWPLFHNGVAASLRIDKHAKLDSTWILFNKCKATDMSENEHAGFLMGLGLNGHLEYLANYNIHDYLTRIHEMISVGLILGMAAGKRGTMDVVTTKALSLHLRALLPPTSTELDIAHNVQVAAILGLGLVYQGTAHRHTAEVLLSEIGRPPGPELENCTDRESYSLASGLALGMVMFGKGTEMSSLSDLCMADELYHYMVGGHKRPLTGASKERYKSPSYHIMEGDSVNIDVTSPGATLALGMVFFNSGNSAVAGWLTAPDTQFLLDFVRPDFLMLRMISKGLIMWQQVTPSEEWITSNLPEIVSKYAFSKLKYKDDPDCEVDFETMSQAYCNIVAGACMALGLKYAGSASQDVFVVLCDMVRKVMILMSKPLLVEQAGKSTVENTLVVMVLSLAMVMSGTGNLEVLRLCRLLRSRVGPSYNHVLYGSHMAISMAIGLLFLGSCRYTLCTKPEAIAAMLCAFFPKFPIHSNDNRYHLQALRHLFVLASEPRVLIPKDVDSGQPCYAPLELSVKAGDTLNTTDVMAPCILPELDHIKEVKVKGQRYWPISFKLDKGCEHLREILTKSGHLYVKQRAGHLSYASDPKGYHSLLSQSLTHEAAQGMLIKTDDIESFSSDPQVLAFAECFCTSTHSREFDLTQFLSKVLYECVSHEKLEVLALYITLQQLLDILPSRPCAQRLQQVKLICAFYERLHRDETNDKNHLISTEFLLHLQSSITKMVHQWMDLTSSRECLMQYFSQQEIKKREDYGHLATYLCWFEVLHPMELLELGITESTPFPVLHQALRKRGLPVSCSMGLVRALNMLLKK